MEPEDPNVSRERHPAEPERSVKDAEEQPIDDVLLRARHLQERADEGAKRVREMLEATEEAHEAYRELEEVARRANTALGLRAEDALPVPDAGGFMHRTQRIRWTERNLEMLRDHALHSGLSEEEVYVRLGMAPEETQPATVTWRRHADLDAHADALAADVGFPTGWPEGAEIAAFQGEIALSDFSVDDREPGARVLIDLYAVEPRAVRVRLLIPYGSELEPPFRPGPVQAEGWRMLTDVLERALEEVAAIHARKWWSPHNARFQAGDRVRVLPHRNLAAEATGTIAASPPPRLVRPGGVYWVEFDEPQINANDGGAYPGGDILEEYLQPWSE